MYAFTQTAPHHQRWFAFICLVITCQESLKGCSNIRMLTNSITMTDKSQRRETYRHNGIHAWISCDERALNKESKRWQTCTEREEETVLLTRPSVIKSLPIPAHLNTPDSNVKAHYLCADTHAHTYPPLAREASSVHHLYISVDSFSSWVSFRKRLPISELWLPDAWICLSVACSNTLSHQEGCIGGLRV